MEVDICISCKICGSILRSEHMAITFRAILSFPTWCAKCKRREENRIDTAKFLWAAFLGDNDKLLTIM